MQDSGKDKEVEAPPLKKVGDKAEEVMKGIRKASHNISTHYQSGRCAGSCQRTSPRLLPVKHASPVRENMFAAKRRCS